MLHRNTFHGKNIIIADRGYESYNLIAHLINTKNVDFLIRVKQGKGAFREIAKLPMTELDRGITFEVTTRQTNEDKLHKRIYIQINLRKETPSTNTITRSWDFDSPYTFKFRVVSFLLETGEYETIITSLPRNRFSMTKIKCLYHMRWGIETSFCKLKYPIGLINLHCKKEELVEQEIYAAIIMYNYYSRIACNAIVYKREDAVYEYAINFTMAIHLCRYYYKWLKTDFEQLLLEIGTYSEPIRPGRSDKRNVKPKRFVGFTYRIAA